MLQVEPASAIRVSKLHPPRLTSQHVTRPRLTERLRQHPDRPLILVCAPAGSGKTTILSEWLANSRTPTGWISLDERDNDPFVFVRYVIAAVQAAVPNAKFETRDLLRASARPPIDALVISLSNDLDLLPTDVALVLDDYHLIASPEIDELIVQLLRHPPRRFQLVIATRTEPAWSLATFRTRGQVLELRYRDLQFTREEAESFLRNALGADFAEVPVEDLYRDSEGWAAGLQLIAAASNLSGGLQQVLSDANHDADISDSLFGEIFEDLPDQVQICLLRLSILEPFSASLCEAVCDREPNGEEPESWGKALLSELAERNLFVSALGPRGEFFRFHHLFRRFLFERLRECSEPEEIALLQLRASAWYATQGLIEEAIELALAGGDAETAADLVAQHRHDLYNHEQFGRLTHWLRLLPMEVKQDNPELLLAEARIATLNWRFTEAAVALERAEEHLRRAPLVAERAAHATGELLVLHAILHLWTGAADHLVHTSQRALELLPLDSSHLRGLAIMGVAIGAWQRGDRVGAWQYLNENLAESTPQLPIYATLLQIQGFFSWLDMSLSDLLVIGRRLQTVSEELDLPDHSALAHYFQGIAHFARNELELASQHLETAAKARFNMRLYWWCQAIGTLALTQQLLGQEETARQTMADARDFLLERHALRVLPSLGAFQADLDLRQGRLAEASAWAVEVEPPPLVWSVEVVEPRLVQARILLSMEREDGLDQAIALIAEMRAFCERLPNHRRLMEVEALTALIEVRRGERAAALKRVQRLVLATEGESWVRLFATLGEPMELLLRQLLARRVAPHAISRILAAFPARHGVSGLGQQSGLTEPLSERELEILALLRGRDSNKEIAERLYIAPSTVKRHTLNIYRKLEVNDRRAAVGRAAALGLFPPESFVA